MVMFRNITGRVCWLTLLCLVTAGCEWFQSDVEVDSDLDAVAISGADADRSATATAPVQKLTLNLKAGDRFPLLKTVEQELKQPSPKGWNISQSKLELTLLVTLQEIIQNDPQSAVKDPRDGQKRFQVRYHRVKFSQNMPGQEVEYDSNAPPNPVPLAAQVYHGLKDNSFEFWIGADNQILELVGFKPFLERCLKDVPPAQRQQVWDMLAAATGADGIANFVDDSIGLLPPNAVRLGETWTNSRNIPQPVPMHVNNKYTLRQISPQTAEIDIVGTIAPSATYGPADQPSSGVQVTIRGGHSLGSCTIDRRTGLPVQSKVEQSMQMKVRMSGGIEFDQQKTAVTTIRAFPLDGTQTAAR